MPDATPLKLNPITGEIQQFQPGDTAGVVFGGVGQKYRGSVPQQSGNTVIAYNNTAPGSTAGTLLWSKTITPTSVDGFMHIVFDSMIDTSATNLAVTIAIFRNNQLIGFKTASSTAYNGNMPCPLGIDLYDQNTSLVPVTYSCRIGISSGTWYLGRGKSATQCGVNPSWWSIEEESL